MATPTLDLTTQPTPMAIVRAVRELGLPLSQNVILRVLIERCKWSDIGFTCFPSVATLAEDCSISPRTATACLTALAASGWLLRAPRGRTSNLYKVDVHRILRLAHEAIQRKSSSKDRPTLGDDQTNTLLNFGEAPSIFSLAYYRAASPTCPPTPTPTKPVATEEDNTDFLDARGAVAPVDGYDQSLMEPITDEELSKARNVQHAHA